MTVNRNVTLHVCATCRVAGEPLEPRERRSGARLHAALTAARSADDPVIRTVECFSACRQSCAISLSAPGCWTYVFGGFSSETPPDEIFAAAKLYRDSGDGIIPWGLRSEAFKSGVVARLPPSAQSIS